MLHKMLALDLEYSLVTRLLQCGFEHRSRYV